MSDNYDGAYLAREAAQREAERRNREASSPRQEQPMPSRRSSPSYSGYSSSDGAGCFTTIKISGAVVAGVTIVAFLGSTMQRASNFADNVSSGASELISDLVGSDSSNSSNYTPVNQPVVTGKIVVTRELTDSMEVAVWVYNSDYSHMDKSNAGYFIKHIDERLKLLREPERSYTFYTKQWKVWSKLPVPQEKIDEALAGMEENAPEIKSLEGKRAEAEQLLNSQEPVSFRDRIAAGRNIANLDFSGLNADNAQAYREGIIFRIKRINEKKPFDADEVRDKLKGLSGSEGLTEEQITEFIKSREEAQKEEASHRAKLEEKLKEIDEKYEVKTSKVEGADSWHKRVSRIGESELEVA